MHITFGMGTSVGAEAGARDGDAAGSVADGTTTELDAGGANDAAGAATVVVVVVIVACAAFAIACVIAPMPPIACPQAPFLPFTSPNTWCSST